ncbi:MAG: PAS domain S-box protein [Nitrospirota bacterium]
MVKIIKRFIEENKAILIAFGLAMFFWIFESSLHASIFHTGAFIEQIFMPANHELWMRLVVVSLLIISGSICQIMLTSLKRSEQELKRHHVYLDDMIKERTTELEKINEDLANEIETRKQSENSLRENEEKLRTVIEASLDAILAIDSRARIILFNTAAEDLFKYSSEEILEKPLSIICPENTAEIHQKRVEQFLKEGFGQCGHIGRRLERTFRRKDGAPFMAEVAMAGGRIDGKRLVVASIHDITERKKAEDALKRLSHQNQLILESAGEGIFGLDTEGKVMFVNPAAAKMLGYDLQELIGKIHHNLAHYMNRNGIPYPEDECPICASYKNH